MPQDHVPRYKAELVLLKNKTSWFWFTSTMFFDLRDWQVSATELREAMFNHLILLVVWPVDPDEQLVVQVTDFVLVLQGKDERF